MNRQTSTYSLLSLLQDAATFSLTGTVTGAECGRCEYRAVNRQAAENAYVLKGFSRLSGSFLLASHIAHQVSEQGNYKHIHAHFCHDATTVAWMVNRLCRLPFSFTAHAKDIYQWRLNLRDLLQRKLNAVTFVVTCTEANVEALRALTANPHRVHGIYHGLDTCLFVPDRTYHTRSRHVSELPVILSVGRHVEMKGRVFHIESSRILRDRGIHYRVYIVGDCADQTSLMRRMIDVCGLRDIIDLSPPLPQSELVQCYHQSRLFVLPCIVLEDGDRDGIRNVMAEAMACALPDVVAGISGIPELVDDEETGLNRCATRQCGTEKCDCTSAGR